MSDVQDDETAFIDENNCSFDLVSAIVPFRRGVSREDDRAGLAASRPTSRFLGVLAECFTSRLSRRWAGRSVTSGDRIGRWQLAFREGMGSLADGKYSPSRESRVHSLIATIWKRSRLRVVRELAPFSFARFGIRYAIIFALNAISRAASLAVRPAGSS